MTDRDRFQNDSESANVIDRLFAEGQEQLGRLAQELLQNPKFSETVGRAATKAFEAKGRVDENLQSVLGLLNLPSTKDIRRLATKIEALQGSLVNLNMKLDRVLAQQKEEREKRADPSPEEP